MPRGTFFHLSRKLGFVVLVDTILYSWTQRLKAWEVQRQYSTYQSALFSRSKIKTSCPIDKWIVLQRVHFQIYFQKAQVVLVLECRVEDLQEPFDVLPVECNVERLTYSTFPCSVGWGLLKEPLSTGTCNEMNKATLTINPTSQGHIKQQSIHSGTRRIPEGLRAVNW